MSIITLKNRWVQFVTMFLVMGALFSSTFAWWRDNDHYHYRYHDHFHRGYWHWYGYMMPSFGTVFYGLPYGYMTMVVGNVTYIYDDGVYLKAVPNGYIVVPAPEETANTTVPSAPSQASTTKDPSVSTPVQMTSAAVANKPAVGDTVVINIPNSKGGFTPVALVKQKDGYTGPQGEFYPQHPTVDKLKILYGN